MSSPYERPSGSRWRFASPPVWPSPPAGWAPGPGWQPPAEWPQPPASWAFWVRDQVWAARHPVWTSVAAGFVLLLAVGTATADPPAEPTRPVAAAGATAAEATTAGATTAGATTPPATTTAPTTPAPTTTAATTAPASAAPATTAPAATTPVAKVPVVPYYANCAAVRAAGRAPLRQGQPGYRTGLDGDADGIACEVTTARPSTAAPRPTRPPAPPRTTPPPAPEPPADVYYANCAAAWAAGAAPLTRGDPGYRPGLDGDGDGRACERRP